MSNPYALGVLLEAGDLPAFTRMSSGASNIGQRVRAATLTHLGEWPLDTSKGIDWRHYLQTRPFDTEGLMADLAVAWAAVPGVVEVLSIDADVSIEGDATITGQLQIVTGGTLAVKASANVYGGDVSAFVGFLAVSGVIIS